MKNLKPQNKKPKFIKSLKRLCNKQLKFKKYFRNSKL